MILAHVEVVRSLKHVMEGNKKEESRKIKDKR
jgi:hypothetical protein